MEHLDGLEELYVNLYGRVISKLGQQFADQHLSPPRKIGSGILNIHASMTDHANNERATNDLLVKELVKRAPKFIKNWDKLSKEKQGEFVAFVQAFCFDHKRNLFCDECVREETKLLNISIGKEKEKWELGSGGNLVNAVLRQCHKEFSGLKKDAYEFGHGTVAFLEWIKNRNFHSF